MFSDETGLDEILEPSDDELEAGTKKGILLAEIREAERQSFEERGFFPGIDGEYRLTDKQICELIALSWDAEKVYNFLALEHPYRLKNITRFNMSYELYEQYAERFSGKKNVALHIETMYCEDITPEMANRYDERFTSKIHDLFRDGCTSEIANSYDQSFDQYEIALFFAAKVLPRDANTEHPLSKLFQLINSKNYWCLGTGIEGAFIRRKTRGAAFKVSKNAKKEHEFLQRLKALPQEQVNTEVLDGDLYGDVVLPVKYVAGESLDYYLRTSGAENGNPKKAVIHFASGIVNGLCEMRRAGIFYHKDIRPANIMIDKKRAEAVIIDLACATTNRHAMLPFSENYEGPVLNRRYSGPNDLVSVAQIMYKMATGEHLFNESKSQSESLRADDIHDQRTQAFANPEVLEHYKQKIVDNVNDEGLADAITTLLTAKNYEYGKMNRKLQAMKEAYE